MPKVKNPFNDDHYDGNDDQIDDLKDAVRALQATITRINQTATCLLDQLIYAYGNYPTIKVETAVRNLREEVKQAVKDSAEYPGSSDSDDELSTKDDPWETGELGRDEAHVRRATPEREAAVHKALGLPLRDSLIGIREGEKDAS